MPLTRRPMPAPAIPILAVSILAALLLTGRLAQAGCLDNPIAVPDQPYSLGTAPLKAPTAHIPASAKPVHPCPDDEAKDCDGLDPVAESYQTYIDTDGVHYWLSVGYQKIAVKELFDLAHYPHPLVAGIKPGDSRDTVIRKLTASPIAAAFDGTIRANDKPDDDVFSYTCLKGRDGLWGYNFSFDKDGHLIGIRQDNGPLPEE